MKTKLLFVAALAAIMLNSIQKANAQANTSLNNLTTPTAVNQSLIPGTSSSIDIGSFLKQWKDIYMGGSLYFNGSRFVHAGAASGNAFLGSLAGLNITTGNYNIGTGYRALNHNTTGTYNIANGSNALFTNTTGNYNTASGASSLFKNSSGRYNTANGYFALYSNTNGYNNTASGANALYANTTGYSNVAIGKDALHNNTIGHNMVAIGDSALYNQAVRLIKFDYDAFDNVAIGSKALYSNTEGLYNTASGSNALYSNTRGDGNTANGFHTLTSNSEGNFNTANGYYAMGSNVTGFNNTASGADALRSNTTGDNNTAIGYYALNINNGYGNTASGSLSLPLNTSGILNTANGYEALSSNITGQGNTAIGAYALPLNNASYNVSVGYLSGNNNVGGGANTFMGYRAGYSSVSASDNSIFGYDAGFSSTGGENSFFGSYAGRNNTTGTRNTFIGRQADGSSGTLINCIAIGYASPVNASNKAVVGNTTTQVIGGWVGWSNFSDGRFKKDIKQNVPGLMFINKLNPVTYRVELTKFEKFLSRPDSLINTMKNELSVGEQKLHTGFIAQEVEKTAKEIGYDFDGVNHPQNDKDNYSLVYADFVPSLVKAVQELSKANEDKDTTISYQQKQIDELKNMLLALQQKVESCSPCGSSAMQSTNNSSVTLTNNASLEQNIPNPFANTTIINYTLPQKFNTAQIIITDNNGKTIKQVNISGAGKGSLTVDATTLIQGAYHYALFVDGKMIDTKQMVLVK